MDLILTVIADPNGTNMVNHTKAFAKASGTLGRSDKNDWVLPDPERIISSTHCRVEFTDGKYHLVDTSTNGVFVNEASSPLGNGVKHPLADGDILGLGEYKVRVSLRAPQTPKANLPDGLDSVDFLDGSDKTTFSASMAPQLEAQAKAQQFDDFLEAKPSVKPAPNSDWGFAAGDCVQPTPSATSPTDPLSLFDAKPSEPMGGFGQQSATNAGGWDDDWWKDGSTSDHATPTSHNFQAPAAASPGSTPNQPPGDPFAKPFAPAAQGNNSVPVTGSEPWASGATAPQPSAPYAPAGASTIDALLGGTAPLPTPAASGPAFSTQNNPFAASAAIAHGAAITSPNSINAPGETQAISQGAQQATSQPVPVPAPEPQQPPAQAIHGANHPAQNLHAAQMNLAAATGSGAEQPALQQALGLSQAPSEHKGTLINQVAAIVKETTHRLIDLLRARNSIKNELRVQRTMIQSVDNNPLKFSANAADALNSMFANNSNAFMSPLEAVQDSFDDLSDHQVAVLAGMRAAYDAMFKHFSPSALESRFNQSNSLLASKQAKNWAAYCEHYQALCRDRESTYEDLFGEEFAAAYEKQLTDLKNARALSRRSKTHQ
ncbi:type VI secretion system-associated FHA domain protein TagH [Simiduia sp. 21SJ11W-1]|uniref:type VI secretion system-associated FHA domain protein TagH n=1 Tax=Simiduia sp. 21SJ11W-1 TaxID=2909669 RepID=UPI0020A21699|nr:type VI secretion system-associated FHA domain protein TagH [Simiduia sp. 21SJ11W-1]UTA46614.1 type VI secretion system-associated FHA domain protein TagH [Simiduia sp. 21SJ11W-1]